MCIYIYIYIYILWEEKRMQLKMEKCSCVLFSSHNIYSALLQRIEHCSTRKSTCRLPIYIYIYICKLEKRLNHRWIDELLLKNSASEFKLNLIIIALWFKNVYSLSNKRDYHKVIFEVSLSDKNICNIQKTGQTETIRSN